MQPASVKTSAIRPSPIHGILFDKDGTLLDFCATWIPAYRAAAGARSRCSCMCS